MILSQSPPFPAVSLLLRWTSLLVTTESPLLLCLYRRCEQRRGKWNVFWSLVFVKSRKTINNPRRPILEAENSGILGHQSPFHETSRKINDVLVQWLCQTTASQFHNPNDTREVLFCPCFSYMLKSQSSVGLQQRKSIPEAYITCCSAEFSRWGWVQFVSKITSL